jgi:hypothetical protein
MRRGASGAAALVKPADSPTTRQATRRPLMPPSSNRCPKCSQSHVTPALLAKHLRVSIQTFETCPSVSSLHLGICVFSCNRNRKHRKKSQSLNYKDTWRRTVTVWVRGYTMCRGRSALIHAAHALTNVVFNAYVCGAATSTAATMLVRSPAKCMAPSGCLKPSNPDANCLAINVRINKQTRRQAVTINKQRNGDEIELDRFWGMQLMGLAPYNGILNAFAQLRLSHQADDSHIGNMMRCWLLVFLMLPCLLSYFYDFFYFGQTFVCCYAVIVAAPSIVTFIFSSTHK